MTEQRDDVALLRELLEKANEPCPTGSTKHPSLVGGHTPGEQIVLSKWRERRALASAALLTALPGLLDDRERLERAEKALREVELLLGELVDKDGSPKFYGIGVELQAKLTTIVLTTRAALQPSSEERA